MLARVAAPVMRGCRVRVPPCYSKMGKGPPRLAPRPRRKPGAARQMAVLFWRSYVDIIRNPTLLRLHVAIAIAMGLLTGFVFWNLELNNVGEFWAAFIARPCILPI